MNIGFNDKEGNDVDVGADIGYDSNNKCNLWSSDYDRIDCDYSCLE
jgi:hypothetical protein